jgi:hypothetical protein
MAATSRTSPNWFPGHLRWSGLRQRSIDGHEHHRQFQYQRHGSTQHEYTVDGVTNYNLGNNTGALVSVNPDALEEVKILTSNYQASMAVQAVASLR